MTVLIKHLTNAISLLPQWDDLWQTDEALLTVNVELSSRLTRSLGLAYPERMLIRINSCLMSKPLQELLPEVLCHEAAHIAVYLKKRSSAKPHGALWKSLVSKAGFTPTTTLEISPKVATAKAANRKKYLHRCPVCQATRIAGCPQPNWKCTDCVEAGLDGSLVITRMQTVRRTA